MQTIIIAYSVAVIARIVLAYGAVQEERDPIDRPLIWAEDMARTLLALFGFGLFILSLYFGYKGGGLKQIVFIALVFFLILPFLNSPLKKLMKKLGI